MISNGQTRMRREKRGVIFVLEYLAGRPKMAGCCCVLRLSVCAWVEPRREGVILVLVFREDA